MEKINYLFLPIQLLNLDSLKNESAMKLKIFKEEPNSR